KNLYRSSGSSIFSQNRSSKCDKTCFRLVCSSSCNAITTWSGLGDAEMSLICLSDFEAYARDHLPKATWEYYAAGADDCCTRDDNLLAFKRIRLRPRMLRDVSVTDTKTTILGTEVSCPIGIAPTAFHCLAWPDGEMSTARAAEDLNLCYVASTYSTCSVEEIVAAAPEGLRWFQLYVYRDRKLSEGLVHRAEALGFKALVLTVDVPYTGKRRSDIRNNFRLPPHLKVKNFEGVFESAAPDTEHGSYSAGERSNVSRRCLLLLRTDAGQPDTKDQCGPDNYGVPPNTLDPSISWKDIYWLRNLTRLPIIIKGILTKEDAELAVEHGVQGIIVSNHGGRQLDGELATVLKLMNITVSVTFLRLSKPFSQIDALSEIVEAVQGRIEVYIDGGIRTGSDVLKALALGAKCVFIGRPIVWGLAYKVCVDSLSNIEICTRFIDHWTRLPQRFRDQPKPRSVLQTLDGGANRCAGAGKKETPPPSNNRGSSVNCELEL
ncbi:hypothetical protein AB205_0003410, partial [Aquarana catesbeiana]